jgi:hypothetical protein
MHCEGSAPARRLEKETLVMSHRYDVAIVEAVTAGLPECLSRCQIECLPGADPA